MKIQLPHDENKLKLNSRQAIYKPEDISSVVLKRLIEEVRMEKVVPTTAYNRVHNRHNRGR